MDLSVVIPIKDERDNLVPLHERLRQALQPLGLSYEILFVDDGSTDKSFAALRALHERDPRVRVIQFRRNYGKTAGLVAAFERCRGEVVITMDADLQDSPDEIPELYRMVTVDGFDLVSGWKKSKSATSKAFLRVWSF